MNSRAEIELINERLASLFEALYHHSEMGIGQLTIYDRICINQERASLMDRLNHINGELEWPEVRHYNIPEHIEQKIRYIESKI